MSTSLSKRNRAPDRPQPSWEPRRLNELSEREKLTAALNRRLMRLPLYDDQAALLREFDAADLLRKEGMLGDLWGAWRDRLDS